MTELLTGWNELIFAFALFFLSHIIPVRPTIREWLIRHIGKALYLAAYSVLSIILFVWLIVAVGRAPYLPLWPFAPWQLWIPNVAMPFACLLLTFGMAVPNPLSIASRNDEHFDPDHPGIAGVTRHPVLWAAALWAIAHIVPNGDLAHVLLFGLFGAFSHCGYAGYRCPQAARPRYRQLASFVAPHIPTSARRPRGQKVAAVIRQK